MRYSLSAIGGTPGDIEIKRAKTIGFICDLARRSPFHGRLSLKPLLSAVDSAFQLDQIKFYFSDYGECMGYVTWALLAPDVEQRFLLGKELSLHIAEWNEGASLWIIDFLVSDGALPYVLRDMRDDLFKDYDTITYFRYKNGQRIAKRLSRQDGGAFFRVTGRP
ncbi:MAG: toxin-activating lysine-acyltransferase [Methylococcales bacterium]